jgi:hypothetical protein
VKQAARATYRNVGASISGYPGRSGRLALKPASTRPLVMMIWTSTGDEVTFGATRIVQRIIVVNVEFAEKSAK